MQFSNEKYVDITFVYGFRNGNALESCREYQRRFSNRCQPSRRVFPDAFQKMRQGAVANRHTSDVNLRYNAAREEEVIDAVLDKPGISTRRIAIFSKLRLEDFTQRRVASLSLTTCSSPTTRR
ncbi:hypothetical protein ILUMI_20682 [Ignelater luminosus]|uniref:DUF4817 domain-containing protein n=1 Tax=Ignelater luminosus TaxID=2038154 RepID=A0A8K0CKB7_IGNLU|nr:hypothetical protein ILUMI_20682 [Ignelater luminosus]